MPSGSFCSLSWQLKFRNPTQKYWLAIANTVTICLYLWSMSLMSSTIVHEGTPSRMVRCQVSQNVRPVTVLGSRCLSQKYSTTESKCLVPAEINILNLNLPSTCTMLCPNLPFGDLKIILFTIVPFWNFFVSFPLNYVRLFFRNHLFKSTHRDSLTCLNSSALSKVHHYLPSYSVFSDIIRL